MLKVDMKNENLLVSGEQKKIICLKDYTKLEMRSKNPLEFQSLLEC